jgi:predicted MFS family arabinose efflux permease
MVFLFVTQRRSGESMSETKEAVSQRPNLVPMTRSEWALILILVAIHFTHMVDFVIIMPLGDRLMKELNISPAQFGMIVSAYAIAAGIASLLASLAMDRFDRKSVLLTMYAGFGLSTLFCGLAPNYELLLLARTLAGVFGGLAAVAIMAVIGDVFPSEKRGRAMGAISSSFAVASILGLPLGLKLAEWYGRGAPFIVLAAFSVLVWAIGYFRLPPVRGHLNATRSSPMVELVAVASNPNHQRAFAFTFFLVLGTFTVASFIAPYLTAMNGWNEGDLAMVYLASGIITLIGMNGIGQLADRVQRLLLFRIFGMAALVMGIVLTNLPATPLYVTAVAMSAFMVSATGRFVPAQAMIIGVAEPRVRGAFMSLNTAVQHLATGIAPLIAGCLISKTEDGKMTGFPLVGLVGAGAAVVSLVLGGLLRSAPTPNPVDSKPTGTSDAIVEAAAA